MSTKVRTRALKNIWGPAVAFAAVLALTGLTVTSGQAPYYPQQQFPRGLNIATSFEGWEENPDGSFSMLFGYFNRNWEEDPYIPVGPDNTIEPGGPDRGQPTHFFPRRNKFVFRVPVPKDFGNKELVWTLTVHGKTEKAYASLKEDYKVDLRVLQTNTHMNLGVRDYAKFDADMAENKPPVVRVEGDPRRTVNVREPLALSAVVTDDGRLKRLPTDNTVDSDHTALGLRVAWFVYRGPGDGVTFDPAQFKVYQDKRPGGNSPWTPAWMPPALPADGKFPVKVTFSEPGTYVVRVLAHDGGLDTAKDVTVTVKPSSSASVR